ncbi:MAG: transposase [Chloroflexota bacterium]|nr:transposase [Chloroflexota bacterium]
MVAAGGEVWVGDETARREFPPLRAAWARRGEQTTGVLSGRNARRTVFGALQAASGEVVRERGRTDDALTFVTVLGAVRPTVPNRLIWDNAPLHHPKRVNAAWAGIELAFLPFRSPELMPLEDVWRGVKGDVAVNRCDPSVDELAAHATAWLDHLTDDERRRRCGRTSSKFDWLPT